MKREVNTLSRFWLNLSLKNSLENSNLSQVLYSKWRYKAAAPTKSKTRGFKEHQVQMSSNLWNTASIMSIFAIWRTCNSQIQQAILHYLLQKTFFGKVGTKKFNLPTWQKPRPIPNPAFNLEVGSPINTEVTYVIRRLSIIPLKRRSENIYMANIGLLLGKTSLLRLVRIALPFLFTRLSQRINGKTLDQLP